MNKLIGFLILALLISGCAAGSKTVKPTTMPERVVAVETAPAETIPIPEESLKTQELAIAEPIGITYAEVTNLISEFLDIQFIEDASGRPKFLGASENNLVTLEIIGEKDNILQASMKLIYPKDIEVVNTDLNNAMMLRFLKNAAPDFKDWSVGVKDIMQKFYTMNTSVEEEEVVFGDKIIQILYHKDMDSITLTVSHR